PVGGGVSAACGGVEMPMIGMYELTPVPARRIARLAVHPAERLARRAVRVGGELAGVVAGGPPRAGGVPHLLLVALRPGNTGLRRDVGEFLGQLHPHDVSPFRPVSA